MQCDLKLSIIGPRREKTGLRSLQTAKAQTNLCIKVCSGPLLFAYWKVCYLNNSKHAERRKAWARAAEDDLEDTYRERLS